MPNSPSEVSVSTDVIFGPSSFCETFVKVTHQGLFQLFHCVKRICCVAAEKTTKSLLQKFPTIRRQKLLMRLTNQNVTGIVARLPIQGHPCRHPQVCLCITSNKCCVKFNKLHFPLTSLVLCVVTHGTHVDDRACLTGCRVKILRIDIGVDWPQW